MERFRSGMEVINAGAPVANPVVTAECFGREFPFLHAASIVVRPSADLTATEICIAHPAFAVGLFLGLSAESARDVARWLIAAAAEVDRAGIPS
ncbi:hypothetical protein [Sphingomonas sp. NFR15]|uniref:hypothetical protein n=1 Tax=Sphingomonas sp. NFR15 TaxID=1566282 RepID=UPI000886D2EE|nr:hypothetical protein [Sphingomonas sp. NFR15]SDA15129.1 hypothetical protein SAMN03159340_00644 [Sphingomonas sp. NFR15]